MIRIIRGNARSKMTQTGSILLGFIVTSLLGVGSAFGDSGFQFKKYKSYYGKQFYQSVQGGLRNKELKARLQEILSKKHKPKANDYDEIGSPECEDANSQCFAHQSIGYEEARKFLLGKFYLKQIDGEYAVKDVYCNREILAKEFDSRAKAPGPNQIPDNRVVNVEHTWPQSKFTSKHPKEMQKADLHHLFPTDSEINAIRGNRNFGSVDKDEQTLKCPESRIGLPPAGRELVFEPPNDHKGNVARALFYFSVRYGTEINPNEEQTLRAWDKSDPVDDEEITRNDEIFKVQGDRNPFVDHPELVEVINQF